MLNQGQLIPGLFLLMCSHRVIWGFFFMQRHESPRTPFHMFYNRFPTAPANIIFDNWCNTHKYMFAREPSFFKYTRGYIDKLHFCNHCGCQIAYDMRQFTNLNGVNSQVCEQCNSLLKRVVMQIRYMRADSAMEYVRAFIENLNEPRLLELEKEMAKEQAFSESLVELGNELDAPSGS